MNSDPIDRLMAELARLPGIGTRSAARLAYHIIRHSPRTGPHSLARDLASALSAAEAQISLCSRCCNLAAEPLCRICADPTRSSSILCVVASVSDLRAVEAAGQFAGSYHVLHGTLAPLDGIGPESLQIEALQARVQAHPPKEIILALSATLEGDTTALFLASLLAPSNVAITRLASGVPHGGELEYLDQATLGRALVQRRPFTAA